MSLIEFFAQSDLIAHSSFNLMDDHHETSPYNNIIEQAGNKKTHTYRSEGIIIKPKLSQSI